MQGPLFRIAPNRLTPSSRQSPPSYSHSKALDPTLRASLSGTFLQTARFSYATEGALFTFFDSHKTIYATQQVQHTTVSEKGQLYS